MNAAEGKRYQEALIILDRVLCIDPKHMDGLMLKGFVEFMCGNYDASEEINREILKIDINN